MSFSNVGHYLNHVGHNLSELGHNLSQDNLYPK
jgi:hypothetical protein